MARWNKTLLARLPEPVESFEGWCGFCDRDSATIVIAAKWPESPDDEWFLPEDFEGHEYPMSCEYLCADDGCGGVYENVYDQDRDGASAAGPNFFTTREAAQGFLNPEEWASERSA